MNRTKPRDDHEYIKNEMWLSKCKAGPHFPTFGLNMERYSVSLRIQSKCGKKGTRITPNTGSFCAVNSLKLFEKCFFVCSS